MTAAPSTSLAAQKSPAKLLADGTILIGVDGKLISGAGDTWSFELTADANSVGGIVAAGTRFEMLPCATLELLAADVNDRSAPTYRLSGRVTRFRGKSFLFPTYFLPLSKLKEANSAAAPGEGAGSLQPPAQGSRPEPDLTIPPQVLEKLKGRRTVRGPQKESEPSAGQAESPKAPDRMLVDVVGRIEPASKAAGDHFVFIPDAFGWNVSATRYELLPCAMLEQTLQVRAASPEPLRFNVAGLVTEFKGKQYLLLARAIRAHGLGNFR